MKNNKFYKIFFIATVLTFSFGCTRNKGINEYSEELQINFPENMTLAYYQTNSDFQDYSIISIYNLSFNQKNALLEEIFESICDFSKEEDIHDSCWRRCDDYFSYEFHNKADEVKINIVLVAQNNIRTLTIHEVKF